MKLDLPATGLSTSHDILATTKSPTSLSTISWSSGRASGQLGSSSLSSFNSSTSDGDVKYEMSTQNVALGGSGEEITDLFVVCWKSVMLI